MVQKYILFWGVLLFCVGCGHGDALPPVHADISVDTQEVLEEQVPVSSNSVVSSSDIVVSTNETGEHFLKEEEVLSDMVIDETNFSAYIPTLMFHYIEDVPADSPDQIRYNLSFSPERFESFLQFFQEHNVETLTYYDVQDIMNGTKELPEKAVMLTFDDGYLDHYEAAFPLLETYQMKGVFFIISDKPGIDPAYANWDQLREMAAAGHEIASHTAGHHELTLLNEKQLHDQLGRSQIIIEREIGKPVISLCYPVGKYNELVQDIASEYYQFARTTEAGKYVSDTERYQLPTVRIFPTTGLSALSTWFQ